MRERASAPRERLTRAQKNKGNKQWFRDKLDNIRDMSFSNHYSFNFEGTSSSISEYKKMKVNYDLFNNIINKRDFEHICSPFGKELGELPADFTNKDIISGKIKALMGMEMRRPFTWKSVATNSEATSRREKEEFSRLQEFVTSSIMLPIRQQIEQKYAEQSKGRELTPEEQKQIQAQVEEETKAMTPEEVKKYMERDHQDPAEVLSTQILSYLVQKLDIPTKFNTAWKHALISGKEILWVGTLNGEPMLKVINSLRFDADNTGDHQYIEEGEWACYEMFLAPSEVVKYFGEELSNIEIDEIYEDFSNGDLLADENFSFREDGSEHVRGIRVVHGEWKGLRPIKFITSIDLETGEEYEEIQDESYKLNKEVGDISEEIKWIVTKYEGYCIGKDKYAYLREVPGQHKDLNNLYDCKLSYMGARFDNMNSETTSFVDRMKYFQYFYNIVMYRVELLTASDEGKKLLLNLNLIPKSAGITIDKWMHYFSANKIGYLNPNEEGNKNADITQAAKEIDMSLASDIQKYIDLASYIETRCGDSVGITKNIEGQVGPYQGARTTEIAVGNATNVLEPYFDVHNNVKRNVLQALLDTAKTAYSISQPTHLTYILDDMSLKQLEMDYDLLDNSTYGIFISNSLKAAEALQAAQQLSHAALQNQTVELSDVIKIMKSDSLQAAEELLQVAEGNRREREDAQQQSQQQAAQQLAESERDFQREEWKHDLDMMREEEELKTAREIQKQTILSLGFNEDKDVDRDGMPDVLEVAKFGIDADIKARKQDLDERKFMHQEKVDKEKIQLEKKKNTTKNTK